jgi:hypothetical protein
MTGIARGVGVSLRYPHGESVSQFFEDRRATETTGAISCNVMADETC